MNCPDSRFLLAGEKCSSCPDSVLDHFCYSFHKPPPPLVMATTDKVAELYEHYNQLDNAKEEISNYEASYLAIISSVRGSAHEKQLSAQFISKFFVHFPNHYDAAIDALLDLCEDDDANIRRRAIKELPNICRDRKEFVGKIADVLAQLLLSEDQIELTIVNQALTTLASFDIKSFLQALFGQINEGEEETRERVVKFLKERVRNINPALWTKEVEEFFLEEAKKVLNDVTKDEFVTLMTLLSGLKISKTLNGHNALLSIIKEQAELETPFNPEDNDFLDKLLMCIRHGIPYFSQFSPSTDFVMYICTKVLPKLDLLSAQTTGIDLELLQCLAEIAPFISPNTEGKDLGSCQDAVFSQLLNYVPKPPEDIQTDLTSESSSELPSTQFSHVECLLFIFHQLCKLNPNYFDSKEDLLKDLKLRLQYLARGVQSYINKLRKVISSLKPGEAKSAENKITVIALKATTNINSLIKDFFKIPPTYKTTISLSFKQQTKAAGVHPPLPVPALTAATVAAAVAATPAEKESGDNGQSAPAETTRKRPLITAPEGSSSEPKRERSSVYTPPTGKFSNRGNSSSSFRRFPSQGSGSFRGNRSGGGGGGRGGFSRGRANFGNRRRYSSRY